MKSLAFFLFIFLVGSSAFAINFTKVRLIRIEGLTLSIHGAEPWKSAGPKSAVIWEKNSADGFAMGRLYKTLRPVKGDKPSDMQVVNDSDLNAAWTYPRPTTAPASSRLYESKLYTGTPSSGIVLNLEGSFDYFITERSGKLVVFRNRVAAPIKVEILELNKWRDTFDVVATYDGRTCAEEMK